MTKIPPQPKITKILQKPKNWPKYPQNQKNDQNTPEESLNYQKYPQNPKNDQNTPKT